MDKKSTYIIVAIVVVAFVGLGYVYFRGAGISNLPESEKGTLDWASKPAVKTDTDPSVMVLNAKHAFSAGKHTIVGDVALPNPCTILETNPIVQTDMKKVLVDFVATQKTDEVCAQVVTNARFKVEFEANKDAEIDANYNGESAVLNLIEARAGEDLDNAELYIKG
jgi:hypothetical protein